MENGGFCTLYPATDIADMAMAIQAIGDVRMMIIDPIVSAITGDDHKTATVRRCLQPIVDMAKPLSIAVIGITHFVKGSEDADPLDRVIGSQAFGSLARVVLCAAKSNDGDRRVLVRAKSNIGPDGGGFAYTTLREEVQPGIDGQYIEWGQALEGSSNRLLCGVEGDSSEIEGWLLDVLKPADMISREVKKLADREGFPWRTVQRKATEMKQLSMTRSGFGTWLNLCSYDDATFKCQQQRRDFITAYASYTPEKSYPPRLIGIFEQQKAIGEATKYAVNYIGNQQRALAVEQQFR